MFSSQIFKCEFGPSGEENGRGSCTVEVMAVTSVGHDGVGQEGLITEEPVSYFIFNTD